MQALATVPLLRSAAFADADPRIRHGFTTRAGGVSAAPYDGLNLGRRPGERDEALVENWGRVARSLDARLDERAVAIVEQVHGPGVVVVERAGGPLAPLGRGDALVTDRPGVALAVRVADCVPILLHAPGSHPAVAAVHSGWRGTAAGVVGAAVAALRRLAGPDAEVRAVVGPHIGQDAFEVGDEVVVALEAASGLARGGFARPGARDHAHVDLSVVIAAQLAAAGVRHVAWVEGCTTRDAHLWSHRRDAERGGRQAGVIVIAQ